MIHGGRYTRACNPVFIPFLPYEQGASVNYFERPVFVYVYINGISGYA